MKHALAAALVLLLVVGGGSARSQGDPGGVRVEMADRFIDCARHEIARDLPGRFNDFAATHARIMQRVVDRCSDRINVAAVSESYGGDAAKPDAFIEGVMMATAAMLANAMRADE
jgi:hypothetical protein